MKSFQIHICVSDSTTSCEAETVVTVLAYFLVVLAWGTTCPVSRRFPGGFGKRVYRNGSPELEQQPNLCRISDCPSQHSVYTPYKCCISIDERSSCRFGFPLSHFPVAGQTQASEPTTSILQKVPEDPFCSQNGQVLGFISSSRQLHWQAEHCLQYCTALPPGCNADCKPLETQKNGLTLFPFKCSFFQGFAELS